jgi:type IV pilus assembly protein PilB
MQINVNRLGEMLLDAGLIDRFQLESALSMQRNLGGQIGSSLVKLGYLPEETILEFLETQERYSRVSLQDMEVPEALLDLVTVERMLELKVVPIELRKAGNEKILRIAMTDPTNVKLVDDLQFATGCKVLPVLAAEDEIEQAIINNCPAEPSATPESASAVVPGGNDFGAVDFSHQFSEDPRFDRLLEVLKEKGILGPFDLERIKFS